MKIVAQYREEAARCRAMAVKESNPKMKATILQLARQFEELAHQREQVVKAGGFGTSVTKSPRAPSR